MVLSAIKSSSLFSSVSGEHNLLGLSIVMCEEKDLLVNKGGVCRIKSR